jgi:hypothetical protein
MNEGCAAQEGGKWKRTALCMEGPTVEETGEITYVNAEDGEEQEICKAGVEPGWSCCEVAGCMHKTDGKGNLYTNYDPRATYQPGTTEQVCVTTLPGCTNPKGVNYDPAAQAENVGCDRWVQNAGGEFTCCQIPGCTKQNATDGMPYTNYDPEATYMPGPEADVCYGHAGCTDPDGINYDETATWEGPSCPSWQKAAGGNYTCCQIAGCIYNKEIGDGNRNGYDYVNYNPKATYLGGDEWDVCNRHTEQEVLAGIAVSVILPIFFIACCICMAGCMARPKGGRRVSPEA